MSVFSHHKAFAAYSNYNSVLIGSRAAGMGGAFTALTDDPSASPFYNPATTILTKGSSLSTTVNVYNKYNTALGEDTDFKKAPARLNQGYFRSLPSASSSIIGFKSFSLGLTIIVPDYSFYSGQVRGSDNTSSFLSLVDESLWAGFTFSARLTDADAVGISVYYTARSLSRTSNDAVTSGGGTSAVVTNEIKNLSANSIVPILGFYHRLSPTWSFGASYRPPSLPIAGEGTYYKSTTTTTAANPIEVVNQGNLRAITKIPAKFAVGVAREIKGDDTLSLDFQFYEGLSYRDLPELPDGADQVDHRPIMNFAIGYEQMLRDWMSLRLGFFTNSSSHPVPDGGLTIRQGDHIDMSGFSANLNIVTDTKTSFTFGGYYTAGSGQTTEFIGQKLSVVSESQQVFTMLVAAGFAF